MNGNVLATIVVVLLAAASPAAGMDKQGSAHGGEVSGDSDSFAISGALMTGVSVYNPSYGARPDNSGLTLMRYAAHADIDLLGRRLSVPLDANIFSDRTLDGIAKLKPTELDLIGGVTSTWGVAQGAVELGARFEHDRALDRADGRQSYVDVRARYLYALGAYFQGLDRALRGGDVNGWATLGWFTYNPTYYARPDNTGKAFLRCGMHLAAFGWSDRIGLGVDLTMFTDRSATNPLRPSELDLTPEVLFRFSGLELHLAYERDMPVDRGGLVQQFVYLLGSWGFTAR